MADLYELADRFHDQIVARDAKATGRLVRGYGQTWSEIRKRLDELEARRKAAGDAGLNWLFSRDAEAEEPEDRERSRLENLLREVEEQLRIFIEFADPLITQEQSQAVEAAQKHAAALVEAQVSAMADKPAGVRVSFQRLPKAALQELVGFTGDGTPLRALLDELGPSASESVRKHLVQGIGTGRGIKQTAKLIKEDLGGDLVRALRISRTETLRAYRESSIRGFQANADVVEKWRWTASRSARTCAMCLAMDGQEFPVTEHFGSHVNCRCTPVPVVKSLAEIVGDPSIPDTRPRRDTGPEWFAKQPESTQLQILGPGKLQAYKDGKFQLQDLVGFRQDAKWGPVRWERNRQVTEAQAEQRRQQNLPRLPVNAPGSRHRFTSIGQKTVAKEKNTVIESRVDVQADVEAVRRGDAVKKGDTFTVNGRSYVMEANGTLYPTTGPGFHLLERPAFKVLGIYKTLGRTDRAEELLDRIGYAEEIREQARRVWDAEHSK